MQAMRERSAFELAPTREEYLQLAQKYFDRNGVMLEDAYQKFTDFAILANHISDTFRFYQDTIDFIFE